MFSYLPLCPLPYSCPELFLASYRSALSYLDMSNKLEADSAEHAPSRYELPFQAVDAYSWTFERDGALWFDNAYSDVVPLRTLL